MHSPCDTSHEFLKPITIILEELALNKDKDMNEATRFMNDLQQNQWWILFMMASTER